MAAQLRSLTDNDGVATLDEGHQDDLAAKVWRALGFALGEAGAAEVVETALGDGHPETMLRRYLVKDFWKRHLQQYRKRPVYWLLQSKERAFSAYVFHERATRDTLPLILGNRYVGGKINYLQTRMDEIQEDMKTAQGKKKKDLEKVLELREQSLLEVESFAAAIKKRAWSKERARRDRGLDARNRRRRHPQPGPTARADALLEGAGQVLAGAGRGQVRLVLHCHALLAGSGGGEMQEE